QVRNDGHDSPFISRFPFSYLLIDQANRYKENLSEIRFEQFLQLSPSQQNLSWKSFQDYIYDVAMIGEFPPLESEKKCILISNFLAFHLKTLNIPSIHTEIWNRETLLQSLLAVAVMFPTESNNFCESLKKNFSKKSIGNILQWNNSLSDF